MTANKRRTWSSEILTDKQRRNCTFRTHTFPHLNSSDRLICAVANAMRVVRHFVPIAVFATFRSR